MPTIDFTTMRALLTAVIAAIEAAAVALAVFALIGIPAVLVWWLSFNLGAEPEALASVIAALWQMVHLVPMQLTVSPQTALGMVLPAAEIPLMISLAPLALTLGTALLAYRAGARFAGRGGTGAWALLGGTGGFAIAAGFSGALAGEYSNWPQWARVAVPAAVYALPMLLGFMLRAARDDHEWWHALVRSLQKAVANVTPTGAAALPDRAAEVFRLAVAGLAALLMLGTIGFAVAIVIGYVDIISLSQSLQLDVFGVLTLFLVQLLFLPTAWIWSLSWFAGSGFAVGAATSVTPFETLLGPLPVLPLFGAIPPSWGWAGGLAPAVVVAIGTALGGLAGGRPLMRRASPLVSVIVPVCAALIAGLVTALACVLASGSLGPGRLETNGPGWWQTGGLIAAELAFGMSLGVFARRFDVARFRAMVPASLRDDEEYLRGDGGYAADAEVAGFADSAAPRSDDSGRVSSEEDLAVTMPVERLSDKRSADEQPTVEIEPLSTPSHEPVPTPQARPEITTEPTHESELSAELNSEPDPEPDPEPESGPDPEPESEPERAPEPELGPDPEPELEPDPEPEPEPAEAVDPLLQAFSWDAAAPDAPTAETGTRDWRSRLRSKLGRGE